MKVSITPEFLNDLKDNGAVNFAKRVLAHTISVEGKFIEDKDDHRYDGIANAWIRVVSRGNTALRVIYTKNGSDICLYRAGAHKVEDNLAKPKEGFRLKVCDPPIVPTASHANDDYGLLTGTNFEPSIDRLLVYMTHLPHREVILVSPYISLSLLAPHENFGRFLRRAAEEGSDVIIITKPPQKEEEYHVYEELETNGILTYFIDKLHTKLYLFDIDFQNLKPYDRGTKQTAMIGSSNLTYNGGLTHDLSERNEEACYILPIIKFHEARDYAYKLINKADDLKSIKYMNDSRRKN